MIQILDRNGSFSSTDEENSFTLRKKTSQLWRLRRGSRPRGTVERTDAHVVVKKRVSFAKQDVPISKIWDQQSEDQNSSDDTIMLHYSQSELNQMSRQAQRLAESVAWDKDKHIVTCLHHCYGFATNKKDLTTEEALKYYFHNLLQCDDNAGKHTLRGLERILSSKILEHRKQTIQAVLDLQAKLRQGSSTTEERQASMERQLAELSNSKSSRSKRFARLLAKADAAVATSLHREA